METTEIIAALECCADLDRNCEDCPYEHEEYCEIALMKDAAKMLAMWDEVRKDIWDRTWENARLKKELKAARAERDAALEKLSWLEPKSAPNDWGEYSPEFPKEGM